jgi:Gram-negative bacterial TonB protein C-terminal
MWRLSSLGVLVCLVSVMAWQRSVATAPMTYPDDGAVSDGVYTNAYFNLSYPLPPGWTEGTAGPPPSQSGYYVIRTVAPTGDLTGTLLIAAQDMFFAAKPFADAAAMADEFGRAMAAVESMTIDRPPSELRIAGRVFSRIDFSGVGLFRSTLITETRCHLLNFNLTATSPELVAALALSLNDLGFAGNGGAGRVDPMCMSNYADAEHLMTKVDPPAIGSTPASIPVRIVIGTDGSVKHVHVIRATGAQRDSIKNALGQWKFKPYVVDGRAIEIETGVLIEFRPAGAIHYSTGSRSPRNGAG